MPRAKATSKARATGRWRRVARGTGIAKLAHAPDGPWIVADCLALLAELFVQLVVLDARPVVFGHV
jgi:hypothetical protein